jgi:hypothetical protein
MIHFLRNEQNRTIIECEVYNNDLSAATNIEEYSKMLLDINKKSYVSTSTPEIFIQSISDLDEIRGWWWEGAEDSGDYKSIDDFVKEKFIAVAKKYDLNYVTD